MTLLLKESEVAPKSLAEYALFDNALFLEPRFEVSGNAFNIAADSNPVITTELIVLDERFERISFIGGPQCCYCFRT